MGDLVKLSSDVVVRDEAMIRYRETWDRYSRVEPASYLVFVGLLLGSCVIATAALVLVSL